MNDGSVAAKTSQGGLELEEAAGVAGGDDIGVERGDELGFAIAEGIGGFGLDQIVDSGGAAADGVFRDFGEFELGNICQQLAWLRADALGVLEMARIVEGYAEAERISWRAGRQLGQNFCDVLALCGEGFGAIGVVGIVAKQMAVILNIGAAACGIGNDGVDAGALERVDSFSSERESAFLFSGMNH